jgi:replicative DNA helicase
MDTEVIEYLREFAASLSLSIRCERAGGKSNTYHITSGKKTGRGVSLNTVRTALESHWLIRDKRIPHAYKVADRAQRLDLLAGLMDSDGCWTGYGYEYTTKIRAPG